MRPSVPEEGTARVASKRPPRPPYFSIAMESPLHVQPPTWGGQMGSERSYEHSLWTNLEVGGQFVCLQGDSVVVLCAGASSNLVCFIWPGNHDSHLREMGSPKVGPYPTMARFKFGDVRVGEVRYAADIKVGIAGRRGAIAAFFLDAEIPASLRRGAL